jgi:hypothetical protein
MLCRHINPTKVNLYRSYSKPQSTLEKKVNGKQCHANLKVSEIGPPQPQRVLPMLCKNLLPRLSKILEKLD